MVTYYSFLNKLKVFLESPVGNKVMGSETVLEISLEPGTELERHEKSLNNTCLSHFPLNIPFSQLSSLYGMPKKAIWVTSTGE